MPLCAIEAFIGGWRKGGVFVKLLLRHGRARLGHPRPCAKILGKTWRPAARADMTAADKVSGTFLLSEKCLERFNRRRGVSKRTLPAPNPRDSHERPHRHPHPNSRSALQAHAAVSAWAGYYAVQEDHDRGRAG